MKPKTKWNRKLKAIDKLTEKALKDKPNWKPAKGFVYLKDVAVGELIHTQDGSLRAVVLDHNTCASNVLVLNADTHHPDDRQFYLGKHRWGNETEVKVIGD
tara:strand:- start:400 stop:702 length:303 start_codon:yes stop_codon:yes gene_type:complete